MQFIEGLLGQALGGNNTQSQTQNQTIDAGMIEDIAGKMGMDSSQIQSILKMGLPLIMGKLGQNAQSQSGAGSLFEALTQHEDRQIQSTEDIDPNEGQKILGHVFGNNNQEVVTKEIANSAGVDSDKVKKILTMLAPLALAYLAKQKKQNNMTQQDLQSYAGDLNKNLNQGTGGKLFDILNNMTDDDNQQTQKKSGLGGLLGSLLGF